VKQYIERRKIKRQISPEDLGIDPDNPIWFKKPKPVPPKKSKK